jgi:hypothetical protein
VDPDIGCRKRLLPAHPTQALEREGERNEPSGAPGSDQVPPAGFHGLPHPRHTASAFFQHGPVAGWWTLVSLAACSMAQKKGLAGEWGTLPARLN